MDGDNRLGSLLADLDEAIVLLRAADEMHWQAWLQRGRDQVACGDAHGLDDLLRAFGGMGSFNDLVLSQPNASHPPGDLRRADGRLSELRKSIWRKCRDLKHELAE